ncbi:hypothetical protein AVEN_177168-1 [Araneus ventricosus]|uniref:Uncharacterized protein n=1 Tax=Araneus ventricosus TaxID=182803 RepID=A0A4Y2TZ70_ARAVE|nr:hypothetical protein AVEN_177168-1 [Araneus ventricosus]
MEASEMEEIIYLDSSMVDFSTNVFVLNYKVGDARMKAYYSYVCGIQEVDSGEYDMTGLRTANLAKSKFISMVNIQFAVSESQLEAILPGRNVDVD